MNFKALSEKLTIANAQHEANKEAYKKEKTKLLKAKVESMAISNLQELVRTAAQEVQQRAHTQIADVASRALQTVFGEEYEFKLIFTQKRNQTEVEMVVLKGDQELDPMTACGGGIVDVAAFALRLACLSMQRPKPRQLLVLDEPFKYVSKDNLPAVRLLIESLAKETGIQFLIVTHLSELLDSNALILE